MLFWLLCIVLPFHGELKFLKTPYSTRSRPHNYNLPQKLTSLDECNYMFRVLYKDCF